MRKLISKLLKLIIATPLKLILLFILLPFLVFFLQQTYTNFLNQEKERLDYSQALVKLTERRAYLAENFYNNFKNETDFESRKDQLWKDYAESLKEHNYDLIPSLIIVKKNYGEDVQRFYHDEVFNRLRTIHTEIAKIRTGDKYDKQLLEENIETLRNRKYRFAETLINCEATNIFENIQYFASNLLGYRGNKCAIY